MPVEQQYTPVPGFGRPESGYSGFSGYGDAGQRQSLQGNDFDNLHDNALPPAQRLSDYSNPFSCNPSLHDASVPLTSPQSFASTSYRDLPPTPAPGPAYSDHTDMPLSSRPVDHAQDPYNRYNNQAYQNVSSESYWPPVEKSDNLRGYAPQTSRKKWWIIGGIIAAVVVVAVVVGAVAGGPSGNGTTTDLSDPSSFSKDSRLHQSFWGFAYTPQGTQPPWCSASQANVTRDIQLTSRIRLYGANCNTTALVLQAIQDTKVNMTVWPAVYVDSNGTAYDVQVQAIQDAIKAYGTDKIEGFTIGNEYVLDNTPSASNTSSSYLAAVKVITDKVAEFKIVLTGLNLNKTFEVGTSDAGSMLSTTFSQGVDYYMANVHPYFGSVGINDAASWTDQFYHNFDVSVAATASNKPKTFIAETGWPTQSNGTDGNDGYPGSQGDASVANLQTFLNTFVCQANMNGTEYFFFEAFDEPWKAQYGGVEPYWGLFDSDRNLKNLTIPHC